MSRGLEFRQRSARTRRAVIAAVAATPLVVIGIAYAIGGWRSRAALEAEIRQIAARGEPVWFSDLAVPADDPSLAAGKALAAALDRLAPLSAELIDFTRDIPGEFRAPGASAATLRAELETNRPALRAVVESARRGECRFAYDFDTRAPPSIELPHVGKINDAYRLLAADAWFAIDTDDLDRAAWDITALVDLGESLRQEPFFVSQLVRVHGGEWALDLLELLLSRGRAPSESIADLGDWLAAREGDLRLASTVCAERAALLTTIDNIGSPEMRDTLASMAVLTAGGQGRMLVPDASWKCWWWGSSFYGPWRAQEQAAMLRMWSEFAAVVDEPGVLASMQLAAIDASVHARKAKLPMTALLCPNLSHVRDTGLAHRQRLLTARVALAVCRSRAEQGALPATLQEMPEINVPTGLFSGKPLVFQLLQDGFAVYEVNPLDEKPCGRFAVTFRK